jgi:hypothetical protein
MAADPKFDDDAEGPLRRALEKVIIGMTGKKRPPWTQGDKAADYIDQVVRRVVTDDRWPEIVGQSRGHEIRHIYVVVDRDPASSGKLRAFLCPDDNRLEECKRTFANGVGAGERVKDNDIGAAIRAEERDKTVVHAEPAVFDIGTALAHFIKTPKGD